MDYLDRIPDVDASMQASVNLDSFVTFLGFYILGIKIPYYALNAFYNSSLELKDKDQHMIYNILKNAPDLNDSTLRQMIIKLLKDVQ